MSYKKQLVQIGPLDALVSEGNGNTVILFHGYGADASDLFPLSEYVKAPKDTKWVFPEGIISVPVGNDWEGRAWFPIDMRALEEAMMKGTHRDMSALRPPGFDDASEMAYQLVKELENKNKKLAIGGFSQGAMIANDLVFKTDIKVDLLITLSGTMVDQKNWEIGAKKRSGLSYFQSHGKNDPLLSVEAARNLNRLYQMSGMKGSLQEFSGGHEIPQGVLTSLEKTLQAKFN
jgi:phospholipase/carboxylesterase